MDVKRHLALFFGTLALLIPAQAQPTLRFEHLSTPEGLSHPGVGCLVQDREGFLWFGTRDGLNRYDGYRFKRYKHDLYDPTNTLPHNWILDVLEARDGTLWVSTAGGLCRLDKRTGRVTSYRVETEPGSEWDAGNQLFEDQRGAIWMGSSRGLVRYDPRRRRLARFPTPGRFGSVQCLRQDARGRFWAGTERGLCRFDPANGRFEAFPMPYAGPRWPNVVAMSLDARQTLWVGTEGEGLFAIDTRPERPGAERYLTKTPIGAVIQYKGICTDGDSLLWLGTNQGLQRVNRLTREVITYRADPTQPHALSGDCVQPVLKDRSGMLWVGTCQQGINKLNLSPAKFEVHQLVPTQRGALTAANSLQTLLIDHRGNTWLGVTNRGLFRLDARTRRVTRVPLRAGRAEADTVLCLHQDRARRLWAGTNHALVQIDPDGSTVGRTYPTEVPVNYLAEDPTGRLWIAGDGGIGKFDESRADFTYHKYGETAPAWLRAYYVSDLEISRTGELWIGHGNGGITRFDPQTGRVVRHQPPPVRPPAGELNDISVRTIFKDARGIMWVGTNQGGLNRYDPRTNTFRYVTTHQGLPSNYVASIADDANGCLWLGTDNGLCQYNPATGACRTYGLSDYLPSSTFQDGCVWQADRILFGTDNGTVLIYPDRVHGNRYVPPVHITEMKVMQEPVPVPDNLLELPHDRNFLSFEFTALNYEASEKNQYAYQLVGVNDGWVFNGTNRTATFTQLDPGVYVFRVKASNNDGLWNEQGAAIRFVIHPPWWRTWWAVGLYTLLGFGAVWALVRYQAARSRARQEMLLQQREAEQLRAVDELKTRLFSNLTHEFRTPLTLILSPTENLLQNPETAHPVVRSKLMLIRHNARQLLALINQLLDLAKLEAGRMSVLTRQGNLGQFLGQVVEQFQPLAESRGITLAFVNDSVSEAVLFDPEKWQKILSNLLSNSLKFTPESGYVAISLHELTDTPELAQFRLKVTDSGIGISSEKIDRIFDRFYQADASTTRVFAGTGIGLALVKELTELLGGHIAVESTEGQGTTFTVTVPVWLARASEETPDADLPPTPEWGAAPAPQVLPLEGPGEAPLVLIVEDSTELRGYLAQELASGYRILTAENGQAGWELARRELPDVVISDVTMPLMDGYALTRHLKTDPLTAHVAVMLLTARAAQERVIDGLSVGADDYLTKPFDVRELRLRLENLLTWREKLRLYHQQLVRQPDVPVALSSPDPFLEKLLPLLEKNLADSGYGTEALASDLSMSRRTLHRKMTALLGLGPSEYIRQYRLKRGAQLLREGNTVAEVAFRVGYESQTHFSAVFKEFYQIPPSEYARRA